MFVEIRSAKSKIDDTVESMEVCVFVSTKRKSKVLKECSLWTNKTHV